MKFLSAPFFYRTPPEAASGRPFWMRPLFADRATSGAYRKTKKYGFVRVSPNRFDHLLESL